MEQIPLPVLWLMLAAAAVIILGASNFLAKSADVIAFKTGLGRAFIGVVLLATATSLPELGVGVSSITLVDKPDLAVGDAFGSNLFNLLIIGLLDLYWRDGPILTRVQTTAAVVGALGIAVIAIAAIALLAHGITNSMEGWHIGPLSVLLIAMFLLAMLLIYRSGQAEGQQEEKGHNIDQEQRAVETVDEIRPRLEEGRPGKHVVDSEDRQHHGSQRLTRQTKRQQRNHGRCRNRVVGRLGRDQPLRRTFAEHFGRL